ncbi:MAG: hypothetical protein WAZ27_00490 [Minisyncoccia bacterium]
MDIATLEVMNGAGPVKRLDQVTRLARTPVTDITVGSITTEIRPGNSGDVYYYHPTLHWSVNSWGVPSIGKDAWMKTLPDMVKVAHDAGKRLRASVAIFNMDADSGLAADCFEAGVDGVEINIGCPNHWDKEGNQKPIPSYHPELAAEIFERIRMRITPRSVDAKVSPVEDRRILQQLAHVIEQSGCVSRVVGVNTLPNQRMVKLDHTPALCFNKVDGVGNEIGGLAGEPLRQHGLSFMSFLQQLLPPRIGLIGVGGINKGKHILEYAARGVVGVQVVTHYIEHGERVFGELLAEAAELV